MAINNWLFTSNTDLWATPQEFFDKLNQEFWFTLDPCATPENAKCKKFYTKDQDWLAQSRDNEVVFCNPPYWREIKKRVEKWCFSRGGWSLCFYQQEQIQSDFTILFIEMLKSGLLKVVWGSEIVRTQLLSLVWLLFLDLKFYQYD
mgnify:CR=1 FL=1